MLTKQEREATIERIKSYGDDDTDEYMELIADTPEDTVACHCHECDWVFRFERGIVPNYCPACGARMVRDEA